MKRTSTKFSFVFWRGMSNGFDICAVVSIGGNDKTGQVLELSLFPTDLLQRWDELTKHIPDDKHATSRRAAVYVKYMREMDALLGVCPGTCEQLLSEKCYAQFNQHNAAQPARIVHHVKSIPDFGLHLDVLTKAISTAKHLTTISKIRSMVVGDAGMFPMMTWLSIVSVFNQFFSLDQWLGYTHMWEAAPWLQPTHVASVDSAEEGGRAWSAGWSTFEGHTAVVETMPKGAVLCPGTKEFERKNEFAFTCGGCPVACNGQNKPKRRISPRHGNGDASTKAAAGRRGITLKDYKGRIRGLYKVAA